MELRQLRYFACAAEQLSFSDAAKSLNIAQSTLSQQVRQLEDELGVQLFERNSHTVSLTEAGAELLPFARRTLYDADSCVARMNDLDSLLTGTLDIGVTYSFSPILTETLMEFTKKYPKVRLNISYRPMAELMAMLEARTVDFVLAFRPTEPMPAIESHMLFDNNLAVIVNEYHPLASRSSVALADLAKFNIALPSRGLQARNAFDAYLSAHPSPVNLRIELNEVNILLDLIKRSNMATVLAEATVCNQTGVKAIPLSPPAEEMEGCVHMLRNCYRKRSAMEFIQMLRESNEVRSRVREWFR